jgi:DNA-binding transcriptional LysR family regulator
MLMAKVHAGKLDAAFVWSPIAERDDLAIVPIADKDCVVMLPEGHALDRQPSIPIAALAKDREKRRFPWGTFYKWLGIVIVALALIGAAVAWKYGYHIVARWPIFVR